MTEHPDREDASYLATRPADLGSLAEFIDRCCLTAGTSAQTRSDLRLATEEVLVNIFEHGYPEGVGPVQVQLVATGGRITVTVTDRAPAFDPSQTAPPDLAADAEHRALGGLGWHLVHQVMDEVRHEYRAGVGNVVTLIKTHTAAEPGSGTR